MLARRILLAAPALLLAGRAAAQGCTATAAQTPGPFFRPGTPERLSLIEASTPGRRLTLTGRVLDAACRPLPGARLEFWQADAAGRYDNAGFVMRGHQFADAAGAFRLETVFPGEYPGRTPHIHVTVQAGSNALTTQVYFPGAPRNARDGLYRRDLEMALAGGDGRFDFVLR